MRPSRPTDPAARFARHRAAFARAPAPPRALRLPRAGRLCALPRPA
ncbi:hypothetical protein LMG29660_02017 [Burkholderia puraquae]|uniref:Uncharacterized protein n=1 Tax=Burkholderia puraquae TaxID=1904757 RepID=A0A6J5DFX5_9BURK|nr:hypothetical protein LMG29660_02017 [Burkholderia puraquae]